MDEPSEYIDFMAKYKDWIAIKRLGIKEDTKPEEIAGHLAAIRGIADAKAYLFLGIDTEMLDKYVESVAKGKSRSFGSVAEVFSNLGSEAAKVVEEACRGKPHKQIAEAYLVSRIMNRIGYDTAVELLALSKIYPEIKPPRVPGRFGKGKKA